MLVEYWRKGFGRLTSLLFKSSKWSAISLVFQLGFFEWCEDVLPSSFRGLCLRASSYDWVVLWYSLGLLSGFSYFRKDCWFLRSPLKDF